MSERDNGGWILKLQILRSVITEYMYSERERGERMENEGEDGE